MGADQTRLNLDDPAKIHAVDLKGMLRQINEFPEQCETALGIARNFEYNYSDFEPKVVYMTGTGDSGTAADMAAAVSENVKVPVISDHGGGLPSYVDENSLVVVVDYLGSCCLALQNYQDAKARNAEVVCITGGGKLSQAAIADGTKLVRIPTGQAARTAVGYMFVQLLGVLTQYRLTSSAEDIVASAILLLKSTRESMRLEYPASRNIAKQAAEFVFDKVPVVYGASGYRAVLARRWKSQLGANSKRPAFAGIVVDAAAGEISAWEMKGSVRSSFVFIFLREPPDKTGKTCKITDHVTRILGENYAVLELEMKGATTAERLMYGLYLADYASYYIAMLYEVDPTNTEFVKAIESEAFEETEEA